MKKVLVASILGIALNATSSYGQGYIIMQTYDLVGSTPAYSGVTYGVGWGAKTGEYIGANSGFKADLLFSTTLGGTYNLVAGSQTPFYAGSSDGGSPTTDGAGIFTGGPTVVLNGYTSGNGYFILEVYNGTSYGGFGTTAEAQSAIFAISGIQTSGSQAAGDLLDLGGNDANETGTTVDGLQPFSVNIPEPSASALAGLGVAVLTVFRRREISRFFH